MPTMADIGVFPAAGPAARERQEFYKLTEDTSIRLISGTETPALISLWASNDVMQFGTLKVLTGGPKPQQTEWDSHAGDAAFMVLGGTATFFTRDKQTFLIEQGDFMLLPAKTEYKVINYYGGTLKLVFVIAPGL